MIWTGQPRNFASLFQPITMENIYINGLIDKFLKFYLIIFFQAKWMGGFPHIEAAYRRISWIKKYNIWGLLKVRLSFEEPYRDNLPYG